MTKCEGALSREQIEERRKNLTFIRENAPGDPVGDHLFTTTLLMQEEWLATVDALVAREGELVAALEPFVTHKPECAVKKFVMSQPPPARHWRCDCGLRAALAPREEKDA
ncbi:hypothetical protein LCGC14_0975700 [marine sediment metagenome]|uniref:Uncharacterized protein n=1 Tax=marine sediment metagenome TaxID=412755 RepID=A0A0F9QTL8_9ZZZZ